MVSYCFLYKLTGSFVLALPLLRRYWKFLICESRFYVVFTSDLGFVFISVFTQCLYSVSTSFLDFVTDVSSAFRCVLGSLCP